MKIVFNDKNRPKSGESCCLEKGKTPKGIIDKIGCKLCNLIKLRKLLNVSSFCRLFRINKICDTCKQEDVKVI